MGAKEKRKLAILKKAISSADEVIAAQSQKLELLKQHKVGLIQLHIKMESESKGESCE